MSRSKPIIPATQDNLFANISAEFPSTRYQGSKVKLTPWILDTISHLDYCTCLDAFGGSGVVAYNLKKQGKEVTYNDLLRFNYYTGLALVENNGTTLDHADVEWLLQRHSSIEYPRFVTETFKDIYFTDEENAWIDQTTTNIHRLDDVYKHAIAVFALCQACIIKRPYNLFHRKNLYIRLADVKRSFGNKATWDKPFPYWFKTFVNEANQAVFDNGLKNKALNIGAADVTGDYDLVYIDTPYISSKGVAVDYLDFYHFLEGLVIYDQWAEHIEMNSKHRRFKRVHNEWSNKQTIAAAFDRLFHRFRGAELVVSYRSDGIPSESDLLSILKNHKKTVEIHRSGHYKYVLSTNGKSQEILLIGA